MSDHNDFDFEVAPGIPAPLPRGESILWQGKPEWKALAVRAFHVRKVALYFGLIILYLIVTGWYDGQSLSQILTYVALTGLLGLPGIGILSLLAWLSARSTVYTLTTKRILMRFGIALPVTLNLPISRLASASFNADDQGCGDLPVVLKNSASISYLVQWPHVRPWQFGTPQPMLRAVANIECVAQQLGDAVGAAASQPGTTASISTAPDTTAQGANSMTGEPA